MKFNFGIAETLKHAKAIGLKRLRKRTIIDPITNCWEWYGSSNGNGYGEIRILNVKFYTHRLSMFLYNENFDLINGSQLNHKCNNPCCWNPEHLYMGTGSQNNLDAMVNGAIYGSFNLSKTHCPKGHEYNEENTYITKKGHRVCRNCMKITMQIRRDLNK